MRHLRRLALLVLVAGAAWWLSTRWWRSQTDPARLPAPATPWPPVPSDASPSPVTAPQALQDRRRSGSVSASIGVSAWAEPVDGACPEGYPVKAKLRSRLYHLPGMVAYTRTNPDRCYADGEAAEADGFSRAKR